MYSFKVKYFNSAFSMRAVNGTKKVVCILFPSYFTAEEYISTRWQSEREVLVQAIEHYNENINVMSTLNAFIHLASDERKLAEYGNETSTSSLTQALQEYGIVKKDS